MFLFFAYNMRSKTPSVKKSGTALEYDQIGHSRQTITSSQQFPGSWFRSISKGYEVRPTFGITVDNRGFVSEGLTIRDLLNDQKVFNTGSTMALLVCYILVNLFSFLYKTVTWTFSCLTNCLLRNFVNDKKNWWN